MALTEKSKAFAQAVCRGLSNREAAIDAGYSERSASTKGAMLAKDPDVLAYIEKLSKVQNAPEKVQGHIVEKRPVTLAEINRAHTLSDPLEFLASVYDDTNEEMKHRVAAARAALPYVHGKVAEKGKKETKEDAAKDAAKSGGKFGTLNSQLPS